MTLGRDTCWVQELDPEVTWPPGSISVYVKLVPEHPVPQLRVADPMPLPTESAVTSTLVVAPIWNGAETAVVVW